MKNKVNLKKSMVAALIVMLVFLAGLLLIHQYESHRYIKNYNMRISAILEKITEKYPEVNEQELVEILFTDNVSEGTLIEKYGVDIERETVILENEAIHEKMRIIYGAWLWLSGMAVVLIFLLYNRRKDKELEQITKYIQQINRRNYHLQMDDISEDELSILKNEVYKTTVMLKETAELSKKGKADLKNSLSDISHQLKTPLPSMA